MPIGTSSLGTNFEILRYVVVVGSGLTAGASLYLSTTAFDALLKAPVAVALDQWAHIYDSGKVSFVCAFLTNSAILSTLAYKLHSNSQGSWCHLALAAVIGSIPLPFTRLCMWNNVLWLKRVHTEGTVAQSKELEVETRQRLVRWRNDNIIRTTAMFASFALATYAILFE